MDLQPKRAERFLSGLEFLDWITYKVTWLLIYLFFTIVGRAKKYNIKDLPKKQPYIMLGNHTSMMDPFLMSYPVVRIVKMMGSSAMLKTPFLGSYFKRLGVFPKIKYVKDKNSMQILSQHYEDGYIVSLFPEGNRSWNGQTAKISEGIGRLVKRLNAPVVCVRLPTMYLFHPRWATYPRFVPVEIHYDTLKAYPESATAAEITADIQDRLNTTPKVNGSPWMFGYKMAHGLPDYLWACPNCFALESLSVSENNNHAVECSQCSVTWEIDVLTVMRSFTPIGPPSTKATVLGQCCGWGRESPRSGRSV